ncbi:hypothetical protein [Chondromyces crocatus]|uniref:Uncharacterized protein n=1 Tax=Chondromyces crocatus TaxID=52 RepID=A0A0K1EQK9_CHOCO|nr:hypothetical protein [Chondromyces crocatus]AKT42913.1 uncharacterized protein CMC5_071410 [Chondromyces crocatus]
MSHPPRCCDPGKKARALANLSAALPGIENKTVTGGNRMIDPSSKKKWKNKKEADPRSYFPLQGTKIPVLDGAGNLLGTLSSGALKRGLRINYGQVKKMPKFDLGKVTKDPASRKANPSNRSIQYVYAFATTIKVRAAWLTSTPEFEKLYGPVKNKAFAISAWVPKSAVKKSAKRTARFDCIRKCMSEIEARRRKPGKTVAMRIANLDEVKWSKSEWWSAGNARKTGAAERMTKETIASLRDKPIGKKTMFPNARISNAVRGEGNMAVRDYLARSPGLPPFLRCVNFLFAIPGAGGVAMDAFPVDSRFHRLVAYKKQTRIYKSGKATSKKISWYYGYIEYPEGNNKRARRYGWLLKNALKPG